MNSWANAERAATSISSRVAPSFPAAILPATLTSQGDFNNQGSVSLADYVMWRKTMGQSGSSLLADGNGNYVVDNGDYSVWRSHFGQSVSAGAESLDSAFALAVPEPGSCILLLAVFFLFSCGALRIRCLRPEQ